MRLKHKATSSLYRTPGGAVLSRSTVRLQLRVAPEATQIYAIRLKYAYGISKFVHSTQPLLRSEQASLREGEQWYYCQLKLPPERCLIFYYFEIESSEGLHYLVPEQNSYPQSSRLCCERPSVVEGESCSPPLWQISVYEDNSTPEWALGAVMYQIFPDRFKRGTDFTLAKMLNCPSHQGAIFHSDWTEEVDYQGRPPQGYQANDFFGGNLRGIIEELPYLHSLGVNIIYLNPIFKARSNHRYDTGDYFAVDPLLGELEDFQELCQTAAQYGLKVILDGVFSHTGADSRYFNKYNNYESQGAWQMATEGQDSPYASWYNFRRERGSIFYDSWWGFPELPSVHELDLEFRNFICGAEGVVPYWLEQGAAGWRLDVSDELPDRFIRSIRKTIKRSGKAALLLGEIWEDASNKISYGSYRDFILGKTHDCAMGYPFQKALLAWLTAATPSEELLYRLEELRQNYPPTAFYANMNLISTHDTARALTVLAGVPDPGRREEQAKLYLTPAQRQKGEALLLLASLFQVCWPGIASLYYGDEVAQEGYRDPFNRRPYAIQQRSGAFCSQMTAIWQLRRELPLLQTGEVRVLYGKNDIFAFSRRLIGAERLDKFGRSLTQGPKKVLCLFNRSPRTEFVRLGGREYCLAPYGGKIVGANGQELFALTTWV